MKGILSDENVLANITFTPLWPVIHVNDFGASLSDAYLWNYARQHELVIVSKDAGFTHRMLLAVPPPWIVHLRCGNLRKREFHSLLASLWPQIEALLPAHRLVSVLADRIEALR